MAKANKYNLFQNKILADKTNTIVNDLNIEYKENYNTTFTEQYTLLKQDEQNKENLAKQHKQKKQNLATAKSIKQDIEKQWEETSVERYDHNNVVLHNKCNLITTNISE